MVAAIDALKDAKKIAKKLGPSSGFALDAAIEKLAAQNRSRVTLFPVG